MNAPWRFVITILLVVSTHAEARVRPHPAGRRVIAKVRPAVTIPVAAMLPLLAAPASGAATRNPVSVSFTLPEAALPNSLTLTFAGVVTSVLTLAESQETSGAHDFSFDPGNPTASAEIASGVAIPDGAYDVTLAYQDVAGNAAAPATSSNVWIDTTPPVFSLPGNVIAEASAPAGAPVAYSASAADAGSGLASSSFLPASGSIFPLGTTQVNAFATDLAGNTATGSFLVTVQDTTPPELTTPGNLLLEATSAAGAMAVFSPSATDAVTPSPVIAATPASGSNFPLGITTVQVTAHDGAGNGASGSFTVTVRDTTAPLILGSFSPLTLAATLGGTVPLPNYLAQAAASDAVGVAVLTQSPAAGAPQSAGLTRVTVTAQDAAGNAASASFHVRIDDGTLPAVADELPRLEITIAGANVLVWWPAAAKDWMLCSSDSLASGLWTPVAVPPVVSGGYNLVTMPLATAPPFFDLRKRGMVLPFTTYEAEDTTNTTGTVVRMSGTQTPTSSTPEMEASARGFVELGATGQYVEFRNVRGANALVLRHCIPDAPAGGGITATLSLYVNGLYRQTLSLTSRYNWLYGAAGQNGQSNDPAAGTAHVYWDEMRAFIAGGVAAGDTIRLQKDPGDAAAFYRIDLLDLETAPAPLPPPPAGTYLSITDFGANGSDTQDDTVALQSCITAAKAQGKIVWIPVGTFYQSAFCVLDAGVVQGAGMWHTNLVSNLPGTDFVGTLGFVLSGSGSKVSDLHLESTAHTNRSAFGGKPFACNYHTSSNWTVENVWITHTVVGFWMSGPVNGTVRHCRVRSTYADGINLNRGASGTVVEYNHVRGSGDDGIAILSETFNTPTASTNDTLRFNTVNATWWGHNCDLAGGNGHVIEDNYFADNWRFGCLVINLPSAYPMYPLTGATIQRNTVVRGGGNYSGQRRGAVWIFPGNQTISGVLIRDNEIRDAIYRGIHLFGTRSQQITFERNIVDNAGEAGIVVEAQVVGSGAFKSNTVRNMYFGAPVFANLSVNYAATQIGNSWQ